LVDVIGIPCRILYTTPAEQVTYIIKLPTSHTYEFSQNGRKAKKRPRRPITIAKLIPIT